jgi:hypothetical protein
MGGRGGRGGRGIMDGRGYGNRGGRGGARNGIDEYIIRELPSELSNEMPIIKRQRVILK